jgi:FdhE protein
MEPSRQNPDPVARAFERRAARAEALLPQSGAARAPLDFAAGLFRAQGAVARTIEDAGAPLVGRLEEDLEAIAGALGIIVRFAADRGPPGLGEAARALAGDEARARLSAFWNDGCSGREDYLCRALLRPYAEVLAALGRRPGRLPATGGCPFCGGLPWIGWRESTSESEGAQRFLGCALCGSKWPAGRIRCPACGEERPDRLSSFQSDRHPAARIETCATCRVYVKSIDLTVDGRALPEVDDLLSLSLDLWAAEEGYQRLEPGLAGL